MKRPFWIWLIDLYYPALEASTLSEFMSEAQFLDLVSRLSQSSMSLRGGPLRVHKINYSSKIDSIGVAMDYQDYVRMSGQISQLMASNKLKEAVEALYQLILSDISDIDKVAMCVNLATVYDRLGNTDEALTWYDKGIAYEQVYCRYDASEKKAQYLSQLGKNNEAVLIYEGLIKEHFVSESDKERMRKTIQTFLGKAMRGWQ